MDPTFIPNIHLWGLTIEPHWSACSIWNKFIKDSNAIFLQRFRLVFAKLCPVSYLADTESGEVPVVTSLRQGNVDKLLSVLVNVSIKPAPIPIPVVIVVVIAVVARHPVPETKTNERN